MLTHKQICKLARCYTDKRLVKDCKVIEAEGGAWWSNGFIAIWSEEPPREAEEQSPADILSSKYTVYSDREVYPVEIVPDDKLRLLRFSDGNGTSVWLDGKYISAILKRCRKRKVEPRYFVFGDKFPVDDKPNIEGIYIVDSDRKPVACVANFHYKGDTDEAEWSFKDTVVPSEIPTDPMEAVGFRCTPTPWWRNLSEQQAGG